MRKRIRTGSREVCGKCKYEVVGDYSRLYGGCPIGCEKPLGSGEAFPKCFRRKENNNATNTSE